jgi:hypothetical protein
MLMPFTNHYQIERTSFGFSDNFSRHLASPDMLLGSNGLLRRQRSGSSENGFSLYFIFLVPNHGEQG